MEMIKVFTIVDYYGKAQDGKNWFIWDEIIVPENKKHYILKLNQIIPMIFELPEIKRMQLIDGIVLSNHNNGINQYFSFLKKYASDAVSKFIEMAVSSGQSLK